MIIIYKNIIQKYINYLEPIHIKNYARNKNIYITDNEIQIIYNFIKKYNIEIIDNFSLLNELKPLIREDLYKEILIEYKENKAKYF